MASTPVLQRARGALTISAKRVPCGSSGLRNLRQSGSYRAIFPRPANETLDAVIINTAGGVAGGDEYTVCATAHSGAKLSLTTQAAERIYRAPDQTAGVMQTTLNVEDGAQLYWLPQETILFEGCRLRRNLSVDVHENATFLMVEPLVFGRQASGETVTTCALRDSVSITTGGQPLYLDCISLQDDVAATLARGAVAGPARAMASIVLVAPHAKTMLDGARALLPDTGGASLLRDSVLALRLLANDSFALRQTLLAILKHLTHDAVPKNWRL